MADEEDDYMTMTFEEDAGKKKVKETSLQRRVRLQRESRERGHIPSKEEIARTVDREREAALSRSLLAVPAAGTTIRAKTAVNKGLSMMARMGFKPGQALGKKETEGEKKTAAAEDGCGPSSGPGAGKPLLEPIRIQVKRGRAGIGASRQEEDDDSGEAGVDGEGGDRKRVRKEGGGLSGEKQQQIDPVEYRDRIRRERETQRLERIVHAAQVIAERMEEDEVAEDEKSRNWQDRGLDQINVLWRGLIRDRRAAEKERTVRLSQRNQLDQSLRGGVVRHVRERRAGGGEDGDGDGDEDNDDRLAAGMGPAVSFLGSGLRQTAADPDGQEDSDEEDGKDGENGDHELAEFETLPPGERLQKIVDWLRTNRRYCFWCKHVYDDDRLEGCPGRTEEDHD